jgi:hypothetical protein
MQFSTYTKITNKTTQTCTSNNTAEQSKVLQP